MKEIIFKYLDKRHPIKDGVIHFIEDYPTLRIRDMFGVSSEYENYVRLWAIARIGDEYCYKFPNNGEIWYKNGNRHRLDGPTILDNTGYQAWYKNGKIHRGDDLPAKLYSTGRKEWWFEGKRHRKSGPAVISSDGSKLWYENGKRKKD